MHSVLPMLLSLGFIIPAGCAVKSARAPRSYAQTSSRSYVRSSSTGSYARGASRNRYRRHSSPGAPSADSAPSRGYRPGRFGGSSRRAVRRPKATPRPKVGTTTANATTVAKGARVPRDRMIIYNGTLVLRVFRLSDGMAAAQAAAQELGAYLQTQAGHRLVFRVPVLRFHELMSRMTTVGEVANRTISAQDITQSFFDMQHRLKAAEAVLIRLKALLAKARNIQESILIEREMTRLLTQIERYKGQMRYMRHHTSLSTLTIDFQVKPRFIKRPPRPPKTTWNTPFGWVKGVGLWRMMNR